LKLSKDIKERLKDLTVPAHVAIIMDGNGRWAQEHGVTHLEGHAKGRIATQRIVECASEFGIKVLSLYAFSTENWKRSDNEVAGLMMLIESALAQELDDLHHDNVRVLASGRLWELPDSLQELLARATKRTADNTDLTLNICLNYGGRAEITDAAKAIAQDVRAGKLDAEKVDQDLFASYLYQPQLPDPDLLIRSSGEMRVSNFLLYQVAYSEFVTLPVLWPDFDQENLLQAIEQYNHRQRRFGARSE